MPSQPRYFANDQPLSTRDPRKQLVASLTRLVTKYPPDTIPPGGGLYHGPISIAYLFFALQEYYSSASAEFDALENDEPEFTIEGIPLGTWCAVYLKTAQDAIQSFSGPRPNKCGIVEDIMSMVALSAASSRDKDMARELCDFVDVVTEEDASNEWLYGRAGYLYLLRFVKASFADDRAIKGMIEDTADEVIEAILDTPRPWKWHGKTYVGAAHGIIGIITQIVLTDSSYAPQLEAELAAVLSYQYQSGNWPSSLPPGKDRLVQFCHGAPGVITSLLSIRSHFPSLSTQINAAIAKGRTVIKERGLLTKESCLCHGISGNALALEDHDFLHFLTYTTGNEMKALEKDGMMEVSEEPGSLWGGEAGRAWAWAVADKRMQKRLLGYNDL